MTTRQTIEIIALLILCLASLRGFWRGEGFTSIKKLGLGLAIVVFLGGTLMILH